MRVVLEEMRHQAMNQRAHLHRVRLGRQHMRSFEHRGNAQDRGVGPRHRGLDLYPRELIGIG